MKLFPGQKLVYQTDHEQVFIGESAADPDPQSPGNWLVPAGCVEVKPPPIPVGKKAQWAEYKWKIISK